MLEAPEVHSHHPKKTGLMHWFEIVISASVLMLSAGSLYIALHTGHTMEQLVAQNQRLVEANSLPLLVYDHGNASEDGSPGLSFTIKNAGAGPARVVWFSLKMQGREYASFFQLIDNLTDVDLGGDSGAFFGANPNAGPFTSAIIGRILTPGEEVRIIRWIKPAEDDKEALAVWQKIERARFDDIRVRACYCSIFDRCWIDALDGSAPRAVESCAVEKPVNLSG
jgi:hypothetical protein